MCDKTDHNLKEWKWTKILKFFLLWSIRTFIGWSIMWTTYFYFFQECMLCKDEMMDFVGYLQITGWVTSISYFLLTPELRKKLNREVCLKSLKHNRPKRCLRAPIQNPKSSSLNIDPKLNLVVKMYVFKNFNQNIVGQFSVNTPIQFTY
jgi:hypothetical protein